MSRRRPSPDEARQDRAVTAFVRTARMREPGRVRDVLDRNPVKNLHGTDSELTVGLVVHNPRATVASAWPGQVREIADRMLSPRWRP